MRRSLTVETESAADGAFVLQGLRDDVYYMVRASSPGLFFTDAVELVPGQKEIRFRARRAVQVEIELRGAAADFIDVGVVEAWSDTDWFNRDWQVEWRRDARVVSVPKEKTFRFASEGWTTAAVKAPSGPGVHSMTLDLRPRAVLRGKLITEHPAAYIVDARPADRPVDKELWRRMAEGPDYSYHIEGMPPGRAALARRLR